MRIFTLILSINLLAIVSCSPSKSELFKETDFFVQSLQTTHISFGKIEDAIKARTTSDGLYTISSIGWLINVKIQKAANNEEYEELKQDLKNHYDENSKVNDVYVCQDGTIMIDCRN